VAVTSNVAAYNWGSKARVIEGARAFSPAM
jgi:hypothetical protein